MKHRVDARHHVARRVPNTQAEVRKHSVCSEARGGHREAARSGDADDGEGAEVDSDEPVSRVQITGIQSIWDIMYGETASWERGCRYGIQTQDQPRWVPYSHGRDTRRDTDGIA